MNPNPTAQEMTAGILTGLSDLGWTATLHKTDVGTDMILVSTALPPYWPLATIWWHGIEWKALPRGKRTCLKEGWCCSAPALEGYPGETPVPTVERAVEHLKSLHGWCSPVYTLYSRLFVP